VGVIILERSKKIKIGIGFATGDYFTFKIPTIHEFDTGDIAIGYW